MAGQYLDQGDGFYFRLVTAHICAIASLHPSLDDGRKGDLILRTILWGCALASLAISGNARCEPAAAPATYNLASGFLQLMGPGSGPGVRYPTPIEQAHGVTEFDFTDGSRLVVKASELSPGSASVVGLIGSGRLGLSPPLAGSSWAAAFLPLGGTSWGSYEQIEHWLNASGHSVQLNFTPDTRAFHFSGTSSTADLGYQGSVRDGCEIVR